ncbi:type IV pilus biogenesis protein PilM [Planctomycetes bacterium K23_9]|uniref:Competence protein A n=1 Tax=Stieleria marina TaxID=1930275 RepID=A0A517NQF6_9BACT|nr:Competence protein A [Planctomycetes bacterium K23_9]
MPKKLAIDWDESELRLVAAQCSGTTVKITDAAVIPIIDGAITPTLQKAIQDRGLEKTEALIAIGRGKAELRDLELPEVPDDELPDMVRFQAIRSFASAGESATVDYLVTKRENNTISMLAAAVGPGSLKEIQHICQVADLTTKRIALRPLAAASLYLANNKTIKGETVLVDLLSEEAEIVVARDRKVVFVRTVRLPTNPQSRSTALVGELRRSLMACGSTGSPDQVILWGRADIHQDDVVQLTEATGANVSVVNPFDLVNTGGDVKSKLPQHVGRLAPLVGLLQCDEVGSHRLIDFMNPRKRVIKETSRLKRALMIGGPIAAVLLIGFFAYKRLSDLDAEIAVIKQANAEMANPVKEAGKSVERTERVDQFLDGDVNWLDELRRLVALMPDSDSMIVRSVSGTTDQRNGGGTLTLVGGVTDPKVIDEFEAAVRDESHQIVGDGSKADERAKDKYRWNYTEKVTVPSDYVRQLRYAGLKPPESDNAEPDSPESGGTETDKSTGIEADTTTNDSDSNQETETTTEAQV